MHAGGFWRSCGIPVTVSVTVFIGLNALWTNPATRPVAAQVLPYAVAVFMLGGSGVALYLVAHALRSGWLTPYDLGLNLAGWTVPRRLSGLILLLLLSYGQFAYLQYHLGRLGSPQPTWGDYCFNFVICLSASLAEVLVFIGVCFCFIERWLRLQGFTRLLATAGGLPFASVAFGLYHFSHEPRWHPYVVPLMGEMLCMVLFFVATRNFWLTVALHNAFAAAGFTTEQYSRNPLNIAGFDSVPALVIVLGAFVLPALLLHRLEWRYENRERKLESD